jgi:hypothetical protein
LTKQVTQASPKSRTAEVNSACCGYIFQSDELEPVTPPTTLSLPEEKMASHEHSPFFSRKENKENDLKFEKRKGK